MPERPEPRPARRLTGGRADGPGDFPDETEAFKALSPSERIEALRALSRRLHDITPRPADGRPGHPRLPDRLVGGRR